MDKIVMIVAGGTGNRMSSGIPKQLILLDNRPIIMHTLEVFRKYDSNLKIILVLPESQFVYWKELCSQFQFTIEHELGSGGETRFHSVRKNLLNIPDNSLIGIHDGVRPLVSIETIDRCYREAMHKGNAVPCIKIPETLRKIEGSASFQADREMYRLIQTPQVFSGAIIKKSYLQEYNSAFTDDAGVVESAGHTIHLVDGNPENIKITYKNDLKTAEVLIRNWLPSQG